ncbi:ABC transporter ATP-binding protein [Nocardioides guangzhouensis]|uniref:ABC transporter ATP-binding protein n=1 Tax=Nocardioides guangzhouensis TaxID=2497878 RepID=A0A4Q4ZCS6_9ACTN|nr:ABC transporter ATP-binding protein [Nocardioides guangzhouensis]RYP85860.1 ABC transporter ATP-binding protein [Nocardioides guangzhouensis]
MGTAVEVSGLRKQYGATLAVADVSFRVDEGEIFGLLGPNGSGKTTTVECVQGLRRADDGRISVFGLDPGRDTSRVRRIVGTQLQDSALPDRLRVAEALRLFSAISPGGPPWRQLLDEWGLATQRNTAFGDLSGGQQQRLFVALALVADPKLVVLDEMTTGLDPAARRVAWDLVDAVRARGTTVLLVTHFMDEAQRLCDRLAVVVRGTVIARGTAAELISSQLHDHVVHFTVPPSTDVTFLSRVRGVSGVDAEGGAVRVHGSGPLLARVAHALVERGLEPDDLTVETPTLEDAYLALTTAGTGAEGGP